MLESLAANAGVLWLMAAILLGAAELAVPGIFLIFMAFAAAMTGVTVFALPVLPPLAQLATFAGWSAASVLIGRRWYVDYPVATADPLLNDRAGRLVGDIVTVVEPIQHGEGRVRVGDGIWTAIGPESPAGARVRIADVRGGKLVVESVAASP